MATSWHVFLQSRVQKNFACTQNDLLSGMNVIRRGFGGAHEVTASPPAATKYFPPVRPTSALFKLSTNTIWSGKDNKGANHFEIYRYNPPESYAASFGAEILAPVSRAPLYLKIPPRSRKANYYDGEQRRGRCQVHMGISPDCLGFIAANQVSADWNDTQQGR